MIPKLLITGFPGAGKTTLIKKLAERLRTFSPIDFYTAEIRQSEERKGVELISVDGRRRLFAHQDLKSPNRV